MKITINNWSWESNGMLNGLLAGWILSWFGMIGFMQEIFIRAFEWDLTKGQYYLIFALIGIFFLGSD